jgi:iron complex outermembrane receptor protein
VIRRAVLAFLLCCCALPAYLHAAPLTLLTAADVPALVKPPARGERVIALWALDCAYCEPNLAALARLQQAHPEDIQLVLVATDGPAHREAVATRLKKMGMAALPARLYAEQTPQRLDYLIDPEWGGETPRTLVIRADGTRIAISGELTPKQLERVTPH